MPKPEFKKSRVVNEKKFLIMLTWVIQRQFFSGKEYKTGVYDRQALLPGNKIVGPAILVEYSSTIVVPEDATIFVDEFENILITP